MRWKLLLGLGVLVVLGGNDAHLAGELGRFSGKLTADLISIFK